MAYDGVTIGSEQARMLADQDAGMGGGSGGGSSGMGAAMGAAAAMMGAGPVGWVGAAATVIGSAMAAPGPASGSGRNVFDHSGWNVNFGAGTIESKASKSGVESWIYLAGAVVALIVGIKVLRGGK